MLSFYLVFLIFIHRIPFVSCVIRCYNCTDTIPSCDWDTQTIDCPDDDDLCVIIRQTRTDFVLYTMGCLSIIDDYRTDIPYRRRPGCRPAKTSINNDSSLFDEVEYCFCRFVDDCSAVDGGSMVTNPLVTVLATVVGYVVRWRPPIAEILS